MLHKKTIFGILFISFLLLSCSKERSIVITAKNSVTGENYPGLAYTVKSGKKGIFGEKTRIEASGYLDDNGQASVTVQEKTKRSYWVTVKEPSNTCYNKQKAMYFDGPYDENGHFNFEFAACAYLRKNIVNVSCEGDTDVFKIREKLANEEWSGWIIMHGCISYMEGDFFKVTEGKRYFQWVVTRSNGDALFLDSLELSPGDYRELNINY